MDDTKKYMMDSVISAFNNDKYDLVHDLLNDFEGCFSVYELAEYMDILNYSLSDFCNLLDHNRDFS